jgi:hypothetical protein
MLIFRRAAVACVALGLLAGCGGASPSTPPVETGAAGTQARAEANPNGTSGRVLYVADIDGQPGVGQIHVYSASMKNPQLIRNITSGTGRPFGLWVDSKNVLYVANYPNKYPSSVTEFKPGASSPFFQITNFKGYPESVAVDAQGNVFVNESYSDEGYVQEFPAGSGTAKRTIDTGIGGYAFTNGGLAFDRQGNLIAAEQARLALHIVKIAKGTSNVTPLNLDLTNITGPGMGIDKAGNMYVSSSQGASVSVFPPGETEPSRTISSVASYGFSNVSAEGAVYQASGESSVTEIAPGSNSPTITFNCECSAQGVAVSR